MVATIAETSTIKVYEMAKIGIFIVVQSLLLLIGLEFCHNTIQYRVL